MTALGSQVKYKIRLYCPTQKGWEKNVAKIIKLCEENPFQT